MYYQQEQAPQGNWVSEKKYMKLQKRQQQQQQQQRGYYEPYDQFDQEQNSYDDGPAKWIWRGVCLAMICLYPIPTICIAPCYLPELLPEKFERRNIIDDIDMDDFLN